MLDRMVRRGRGGGGGGGGRRVGPAAIGDSRAVPNITVIRETPSAPQWASGERRRAARAARRRRRLVRCVATDGRTAAAQIWGDEQTLKLLQRKFERALAATKRLVISVRVRLRPGIRRQGPSGP
jgi:hypothetical protein